MGCDEMSRIEDIVCSKIQIRAGVGLEKYGTTMERSDLSITEWLTHLQEELMDASVYVERLLETYRAMEGFNTFVGRDIDPIKQHYVDTGYCLFTTKEHSCGHSCPVCAGQDHRVRQEDGRNNPLL